MGSASASAKHGSTPAAVQGSVTVSRRFLSVVMGTSSAEDDAHMTVLPCQLNTINIIKKYNVAELLRVEGCEEMRRSPGLLRIQPGYPFQDISGAAGRRLLGLLRLGARARRRSAGTARRTRRADTGDRQAAARAAKARNVQTLPHAFELGRPFLQASPSLPRLLQPGL